MTLTPPDALAISIALWRHADQKLAARFDAARAVDERHKQDNEALNQVDNDLAELLASIDWSQNIDLARLVYGDITRAFIKLDPNRKGGRPLQLIPSMRKAVVSGRVAGRHVNDMARMYGVHRSTIYRALAEKNGRRQYERAENAR